MYQNTTSLSDKELMTLLVRESRGSTIDTLFEGKSLPDIIYNTTQSELLSVDGIGTKTADKIQILQELIKRLVINSYKVKQIKISSPTDVYKMMKPIIGYLKHEEFHILLLNTKNVVVDTFMVSKGSLNASIVHPREVFGYVLRYGGIANIICVHNHPSMEAQPSREDESITKRLVDAGKLIGIKVLDHIIVGDTYYSFKENDLL